MGDEHQEDRLRASRDMVCGRISRVKGLTRFIECYSLKGSGMPFIKG